MVRSAAAKKLLEDAAPAASAEDFAEEVERIMKPAASAGAAALLEGGVAVAVIRGALVGIHEDVICLAELLEFFLRPLVAGIFVRMEFDRELAIRPLDFVRLGGAFDEENFVIVPLGHYAASGPLETTTVAGRSRRSLSL